MPINVSNTSRLPIATELDERVGPPGGRCLAYTGPHLPTHVFCKRFAANLFLKFSQIFSISTKVVFIV